MVAMVTTGLAPDADTADEIAEVMTDVVAVADDVKDGLGKS